MVVWAPLPWLWHEKPDGQFMMSIGNLGMFPKLPGDWGRIKKMDVRAVSGNVYWALTPSPSAVTMQTFLGAARRRNMRVEDMIAEFDRERVLFRK